MPDNSFKYYDTAWRTIKTPKYYDGTAWRTAKEIKYYDGTTWRSVYLAVLAPTITSQPTSQTYTPSAPTITSQPSNQTSNAGSPTISAQPSSSTVNAVATASFSVTASSPDSGSLSYQWQRSTNSGGSYSNVTTGTGGTTTSYTTEATSSGMNNYLYRCVVTNTKTNSVTFSLTASAGGTLSYQWKTSGGSNVGTNSNSFTTSTAGSYYCVVTNTQSGSVTFNISSTGNGTVVNLWYFNGAYTGSSGNSYTTSVASSNIYCVAQNTRNGVSLTTQSNTVASTVSGTASTNSSSVSATINTTATATSSAATLTVVSSVDTRDNNTGAVVSGSGSSIGYAETRDSSYGDTTTYGYAEPYLYGSDTTIVQTSFASQSISSGTLYIQAGYSKYQDVNYVNANATLEYSTDGGSSWTALKLTSGSEAVAGVTASLGAINLSNLKVRWSGNFNEGVDPYDYRVIAYAWITVYDVYVNYNA